MDVLGGAVGAMRSGDARAARALLTAPWGLRFISAGAAGVHVLLQGEAWLMVPGQLPARLKAGDVVVVRRDCEHGLADNPRTPLVTVSADDYDATAAWPAGTTVGSGPGTILIGGTYYLRSTRPHPLFAGLPQTIKLPSDVVSASGIGAVVQLLATELDCDGPGKTAALPALLDLLLVFALRTWFTELDHSSGWSRALRDPPTLLALELIQTRCSESWTIDSLARAVGLSRATLARRFSANVGASPISYLTWCRMTQAMAMLQAGGPTIAAVAGGVGYANEFAFSKAFKRETGTTPSAYRRRSRADADPY
jgi:AraC-like DNA-binding protein